MDSPCIVVIRHVREKRSKCSLMPIESLSGTAFFRAKANFHYDATGHVLLSPDAPVIGRGDAFMLPEEEAALISAGRGDLVSRDADGRALRPVLLLDSVWRLLPSLRRCVTGVPVVRSLPPTIQTAYPRVSKMTEDPDCGLASIEALYPALRLMGFDRRELLDSYMWKDGFLEGFVRIFADLGSVICADSMRSDSRPGAL